MRRLRGATVALMLINAPFVLGACAAQAAANNEAATKAETSLCPHSGRLPGRNAAAASPLLDMLNNTTDAEMRVACFRPRPRHGLPAPKGDAS